MKLALLLLAALSAPEKATYVYKQAAGCDIRADVYRPPGDAVVPAVFWIHGGALIMGQRGNIRAGQLQRYLDAGFAVVSIDYRLAPETKLPEILEDVRDAWRWLREKAPELRIDRGRIAVVGHSAGGYLTLTCGYRLTPRPRALVSFYGYGDIIGDWYSRPDPFYSRQPAVSKEEAWAAVGKTAISEPPQGVPRGRFYLYCRQQGLWPREVAGRDPHSDPGAFQPWCPLRNVTRAWPPTLLLHGDADTDVPFAQSQMMADELKRHGVEHEFIAVPGGGHGFDAKRPEIMDRVIEFLKAKVR